ncbi:hypothetical protein DL93DRAFT_2231704 [Clavulina sp. PMI_390]|nr:hypothetical protein DL93DRAFT_2231704 [Clavulina sp. PMI_390]
MSAPISVEELEKLVDGLVSAIDSIQIPHQLFQFQSMRSRQELIETPRARQDMTLLTDCSQKIPLLVTRMRRLVAEADQKISRISSAFVPIHTLTPTILASVLCFAIPSNPLVLPKHARNVSQVCRSWRAVALDCSELWTTFEATWPEVQARLQADRSKHRPVEIFMKIKERHRWDGLHWILSPTFEPVLGRVAAFHLGGPPTSALWGIFTQIVPKIMHLKHLDYSPPPLAQGWNLASDSLTLTELLPNISKLSLGTLPRPLLFILPHELRDLRINVRTPLVLISYIVICCPNLEELRVLGGFSSSEVSEEDGYGAGASGAAPPDITLPSSLHTLVLSKLLPGDVLYALSNFKGGSIRHLGLFCSRYIGDGAPLSFFRKKGFRWPAEWAAEVPDAVGDILVRNPQLERLAVDLDVRIAEMFVTALEDYGSEIVPNLRDLAFSYFVSEYDTSSPPGSYLELGNPTDNGDILFATIGDPLAEMLGERTVVMGSDVEKPLDRISLSKLDDDAVLELGQFAWDVVIDAEPERRWI